MPKQRGHLLTTGRGWSLLCSRKPSKGKASQRWLSWEVPPRHARTWPPQASGVLGERACGSHSGLVCTYSRPAGRRVVETTVSLPQSRDNAVLFEGVFHNLWGT